MKKLPALLLALLLCGCGTEQPSPSVPGETAAQSQSATEAADPAQVLQTWNLGRSDVSAAAPMGERILLFTQEPLGFSVLSGKKLEETAALEVDTHVDPRHPATRVTEEMVSYFDGSAVVFLDQSLQEVRRITLPEDALWDPAVTADLNTVYYTTAGAIRAIDLETGLDRLVRETSDPSLTITGLHLEDTVLECRSADDLGNSATWFFSTATGELLQAREGTLPLGSSGAQWFALVDHQVLFGTGSGEIQTLTTDSDHAGLDFLTGLNGAVITTYTETDTQLHFYSVTDGTQTAPLTLEGQPRFDSIWADPSENCVWFLTDESRLSRWDLAESPLAAPFMETGVHYTREEPDTVGLAALEPAITALEADYAVDIRITEEALSTLPEDYTLTSEYQVEPFRSALERLSDALTRLGPDVLAEAAKASNDGAIHISLVRSIRGSAESGTPDAPWSIQFWDDGGNAHIVVKTMGLVDQNFYHGLAHIIDARVMSECNAFDNWERLNPKGFDYDYDYIANQYRGEDEYPGAFIDTYAMSYPTEDRARIFEYAMTEGNEDHFTSDTMQQKLAALCTGIRRAFGLTESEDFFPWEQYLAP